MSDYIYGFDEDKIPVDMTSIPGDVSTAKTDISNLKTKVGTATLNTSSKNLSGAVNELLADIAVLGISTYGVNSSITAGRGGLRAIKLGGVVFLTGGIGNATSTVSTTTNLFTALDSIYRPSSNVTLQGWVNDAMANFTVRTDGGIRQSLSSNVNNCFFAGFYRV